VQERRDCRLELIVSGNDRPALAHCAWRLRAPRRIRPVQRVKSHVVPSRCSTFELYQFPTSFCSSQKWLTRGSVMPSPSHRSRASPKSMLNQTVYTRRFGSAFLLRMFCWTQLAPSRHSGQVGETSMIRRGLPASWLKTA
jgi:hypothetical protein